MINLIIIHLLIHAYMYIYIYICMYVFITIILYLFQGGLPPAPHARGGPDARTNLRYA